MKILESLTNSQSPIRPASQKAEDGTYLNFWIGHVGQGIEDAALMTPEVSSELDSLIADNKVCIAHERFVRAVGEVLYFWELNEQAAIPIAKDFKERMEALVKGIDVDLDKPLEQ